MKSLSRLQSLAYASGLINEALGRGICIYTYPGGAHLNSELRVPSPWSDGADSIPGRGVIGSGAGAPDPLRPQWVCGFLAVRFWQGRSLSVWFSRTIAKCLSIGVFIVVWHGNSTPRLISPQTLVQGFLISGCVSFIAVRETPSLAISAIFKERRMSDNSSCTRPACLAIVADMLKT